MSEKDIVEEKKNFIKQIALKAFKHGYQYVNKDITEDFNLTDVPDNELPFAEWFNKHFRDLKETTLFAIRDKVSGEYLCYGATGIYSKKSSFGTTSSIEMVRAKFKDVQEDKFNGIYLGSIDNLEIVQLNITATVVEGIK